MTTISSGIQTTETVLSNQRVIDMSERVRMLQPDDQQFRTMLDRIGQKEATREIVEWLEDEYVPRTSAMALSATTAATVLTVTTGDGNTRFKLGSVVRNMETGEGYLVTATSANSIAVTRAVGGVAAATSTSAAKLLIVGNASAQGASSSTPMVVTRVRQYNYVQEQRNSLGFTWVETAIEQYSGREPGTELAKKMVEHTRAIEASLFFGPRYFDSTSTAPLGVSGGALEYISTYVTNAGTALTPVEMDTFLQGPYGYGSKNKVLFVAPTVATVFSQMYRDKWQPNHSGEAMVKYGVQVDAFISGTYGWNIPVVVKREWSDFDATSTNYGTYAFLIDMDNVRLRKLRGFDTMVRRNIQEPSATSTVHEVYTAFSLEFAQEKSHGILKGVLAYSAT